MIVTRQLNGAEVKREKIPWEKRKYLLIIVQSSQRAKCEKWEQNRKERKKETKWLCSRMYEWVCGARTKPDHLDSIAWIRVLALQTQWYSVSLSSIFLHNPTTMPPGPYSCSEEFEIDPAIAADVDRRECQKLLN